MDVNPDNGVAHLYRAHVYLNAKNFKTATEDAQIADNQLKETPALLWLEVRLARAQQHTANNAIVTLKKQYPTSDEADWARRETYNSF